MKTIAAPIILLSLMAAITDNSFAIADAGGPKIGDIPPPLALTKTFQGPPASEISWEQLKGKVVVLEFWATWCGPCVKAIPHVNELVEEFKGRPVVFISATSENEDVVRLFLKNHPIKAWIGLDDYEVLNKEFHVQGIPHAVVVGADGRIAAIARPAEIKAKHLNEVLAGEKCSLPAPTVYTIDRRSDEVVSNEAPPLFEISIREHKMPQMFEGPACMWSSISNGCGFKGKISTVGWALDFLFNKSTTRTLLKCKLPNGFYDFELRCPPGHATELKEQFIAALRTTFGLEVKQTTKMMDVYVMTQMSANAPGLHKADKPGGGGQTRDGFQFHGSQMETVADFLEMALGKPVFDETHLKGIYDVNMKWKFSKTAQLEAKVAQILGSVSETLKTRLAEPDSWTTPDPNAIITAARERLELQLTPARRPVQVLEVSKATP